MSQPAARRLPAPLPLVRHLLECRCWRMLLGRPGGTRADAARVFLAAARAVAPAALDRWTFLAPKGVG